MGKFRLREFSLGFFAKNPNIEEIFLKIGPPIHVLATNLREEAKGDSFKTFYELMKMVFGKLKTLMV